MTPRSCSIKDFRCTDATTFNKELLNSNDEKNIKTNYNYKIQLKPTPRSKKIKILYNLLIVHPPPSCIYNLLAAVKEQRKRIKYSYLKSDDQWSHGPLTRHYFLYSLTAMYRYVHLHSSELAIAEYMDNSGQ